ncbi:hypothetical protein DA100_15475 [Vibrio sp. Hep-1b-8]|nr:hypothetical protein DA100_15475 [Vibrio sp. Hep-1b-8]
MQQFGNLSPFTLQSSTQVQAAPKAPHQGVHGVFGDCLPDGWGMLLQDRIFRQQGILPNQLTAMDRLAFVGDKGMGALFFSPVSEFSATTHADIDLATLGLEAQTLFDASMSDYMDDNHDELDGHTQQGFPADNYFSPERNLSMLIESRFIERFLQFWGFVIIDPRRFLNTELIGRTVQVLPLLKQTFQFTINR